MGWENSSERIIVLSIEAAVGCAHKHLHRNSAQVSNAANCILIIQHFYLHELAHFLCLGIGPLLYNENVRHYDTTELALRLWVMAMSLRSDFGFVLTMAGNTMKCGQERWSCDHVCI